MAFSPGQVFAGYTIESVLGTGGMGSVYLAKHPRLPRKDALKLLSSALSTDESFRIRFEREADLAARLIHRNIVAVYDRGSSDGQLWIAMQHVAGSDAAHAARAKDGAMTPERVVHIVGEVGAGLDFAHRNGLLHRDVKPANILLAPPDDPDDPETVLLTDFGIAKPIDEVQHLTGTGNMLATLAYASPEQIEAKHIDRRVDIYALGCVLYELLTGSVPFPEESPFATMSAHLKKDPPKPSEVVPGLPIGFDAVVAKAMAKNRDDRYNTCRELTTAAKAALNSKVAVAEPPAVIASPTVLGPSPYAPAPLPYSAPKAPPTYATTGATGSRAPYHIVIHRTSGSSGPTAELGPIITQNLPPEDRASVEDLIHRARFFDLPARLPLERIMHDDAFLEITVSAVHLSRSVGYEKLGSRHPPELDELVARLEKLSSWHAPSAAGHSGAALQNPPQPHAPAPQAAAHHTPAPPSFPNQAYSGTGSLNRDWSGPTAPPNASTQQAVAGQGHNSGGFDRPHTAQSAGVGYTGHNLSGPQPVAGHPSGSSSLTGVSQLSGRMPTLGGQTGQTGTALVHGVPGSGSNTKKWVGIGLVAALVMAATVVILVLATKKSDPDVVVQGQTTQSVPVAPSIPEGLVFSPDGLTYTISWNITAGAKTYELSQDNNVVYTGEKNAWTQTFEPGSYEFKVAAINAAGVKSEYGTPEILKVEVETTAEPPPADWADNAYMVDAFSELLPSSPDGTGFNGMSCASSIPADSIGADGLIVCDDPNGVHLEVVHFASEEAKKSFLDTKTYDVTTPWDEGAENLGNVYRSNDSVKPGSILTDFAADDRKQFLLEATWNDHSTKELLDEWWKNSTF